MVKYNARIMYGGQKASSAEDRDIAWELYIPGSNPTQAFYFFYTNFV